jgi:iron complex outermembrane receptor protein
MQNKEDTPIELPAATALLLAALLGCATHAHAQLVPGAPNTADTPGTSELETVTVTARRREENTQEVPAPIASVSGHQLELARIDKVQDLQQALPNVNVAFIHARQSSIAVRGIGNNPANEGLEGSVGIYLDNVFLGRPGMAVFELLDIDQIDLLRGPQGTLFGKNTTAGVLNISTVAPAFDNQRSVSLSMGQHGYAQAKAMINQTLTDTAAARVVAYQSQLDGFVKNDFDGSDRAGYRRQGIRGQLLIKPDNLFNLRLIGDYHEEEADHAHMLYAFGPTNAAGSTVITRFAGINTDVDINPDAYRVNLNAPQVIRTRQGGVSAEANWTVASNYKLTAISALRSWQCHPHNDLDFTSADGIRDTGFDVDDWQASQEIRLASPKGERMDYVVGAYAFRQSIKNVNFLMPGLYAVEALGLNAGLRGVFNNVTSVSYGNMRTDSLALFGHATLHIDPLTDLSAGLRFTQEEKNGRVDRPTWTDSTSDPALVAALTPTRNLPLLFGAWASGPLHRKDSSVATQLSLSRKLTPDVLAYAGFASGSKSGGFNINGVASGPVAGVQSLYVDPEKASNFELGFKSQWLDKRLTFNGNVYFTRITGYQTNSYVLDANNLPRAAIINAGSVEAKGVEFDLNARATPTLSLGLNGAYNDARYASFTKAPPALENNYGRGNGGVADLSGQPLNGAPRWTLNTSVHQRFRLADTYNAYVAANYAWRSSCFGDVSNSRYSRIPAYGVLNLSAGMGIVTGGATLWELSVWAQNALDKRYYLAVNNNPSLAGTYYASAGQSRTLGVSLKTDF